MVMIGLPGFVIFWSFWRRQKRKKTKKTGEKTQYAVGYATRGVIVYLNFTVYLYIDVLAFYR